MSMRGKEVRPLIECLLHEKLTLIAEFRDKDIAQEAARLLEKAIVAEWHEVSILIERSERLGKRWRRPEGAGS